jgi:hypothetical protein
VFSYTVTQTPKPGSVEALKAKVLGDQPKAPSTYQRKKAVSDALKAWDHNQKAAALDELLEDWLHTFPKGEVSRVKQRLGFLEERFGTPMERKDPKTGKVNQSVRRKSLAGVLQELVSFVLSAADGDPAQDFGVLDTPENEKVVSALNALAEGTTELVAVTRRDYNALQMLKRLLLEKGEDYKLPDGGTIKTVVGDFFPDGLAAAFTEKELEQVEERKAKRAAKQAAKA